LEYENDKAYHRTLKYLTAWDSTNMHFTNTTKSSLSYHDDIDYDDIDYSSLSCHCHSYAGKNLPQWNFECVDVGTTTTPTTSPTLAPTPTNLTPTNNTNNTNYTNNTNSTNNTSDSIDASMNEGKYDQQQPAREASLPRLNMKCRGTLPQVSLC